MSKKRSRTPATKQGIAQDRLGTLRWLYRLGQEILASDEDHRAKNPDAKWNPGVCQELAEQEQVSRTTMDIARMFADRYTKKEFQALCSLRSTRDDLPLGRKHVHLLICVRDRRLRKRLQIATAKQGWSASELNREIRKQLGTTKSGGRRRRPETVEDALQQMADMAGQWLRWYEDVTAEEPPKEVKVLLNAIPKSFHQPLAKMAAAAKAIQKKANRKLKSKYPERSII